jgi:hypothetical protein
MDGEDGHFAYVDGAGNRVQATRRFRNRHVIRAGLRLPAAHAAPSRFSAAEAPLRVKSLGRRPPWASFGLILLPAHMRRRRPLDEPPSVVS